VLSTAMTIAACNAGPPMDPSTPRPIVRMSTTEEFVLSAFRNFPQFSVQLTDIGAIGVDLLMVCRSDLDNDLVYELTRAYFEQDPENVKNETDPQRAPAVVIPLHPGGARYYREREMSR